MRHWPRWHQLTVDPRKMAKTPGSSDRILHQALQWQVTLWSGQVSAAEHAAFERWLAAAPAHRQAWQQAQALPERLAGLPEGIGKQLRHRPEHRAGRRRLLTGLLWLAGGSVAIGGARQTPAWQLAVADHATRTGERRRIVLADGTRIDLNSATAVDVRYDEKIRRVTLRRGEILIDTAPDNAVVRRPFLVATAHGEIQALGTRFRVEADGTASRVAVFAGAVAIRPAGGGETRLDAGEQARFDSGRVITEGAADDNATAWTRGQLVAERLPLGEFLARLERHRPGLLHCDPAVADLPVSGVFPLDDSDRILAALAEALPLRIRRLTPYWVSVGAR